MDKKLEMKNFKALKRKANMLAQVNDGAETFLDPILDKLAVYMDLHFGGKSFMDELCK